MLCCKGDPRGLADLWLIIELRSEKACVAFNPLLGHRMMLLQVVIDFFGLRLHDA
jgi:hypothetical protein